MGIILGAQGELLNIDMGLTPGGWEGKVNYPAQRDLRKVTKVLALVTLGGVTKRDMVLALESKEKEEISHVVAPLGNLGRNMNLDLGQIVREGKVMVVCHMARRVVNINQTLLNQERVEDKSLHLALQVQKTTEHKVMSVVIAI